MSGALAVFNAGLEAVTALDSLAFGAQGGVVLGDFVFSGFEVPPFISFGGRQSMTVHHLPGGERVIDLLGPDDRNIDWSGTFLDFFPAQRAQQLDQMRADGAPLPLIWGDFCYTVLIQDFSADTKYSQVPYRISCLVVRNEATAPSVSPDGGETLTSSVNDDLRVGGTVVPFLPPVAAAGVAVAALGNLDGPAVPLALAATATALGTLQVASATADATMGAISAGSPVGGLVASADALTLAVATTSTLASITQAQGYVGRASVNLGGQPWQ